MKSRRARIIAFWLCAVGAALWVVAHARYITDLSAFLPARPTPLQQLLVDQLRDGPASRLILAALEGGDSSVRARISAAMAPRLRASAAFSSIDNGAPVSAERDRDFLFQHRYVLSDAVTAQRFSPAGLEAAIADTIANLASPTGLMLKALVPHDPTGEMLQVIEQVAPAHGPRSQDGVWVSADAARTLLLAQTAAAGSDTDAQEQALAAIRGAFDQSVRDAGSAAAAIRLRLSGPGVFAVAARSKIQLAAARLSLASSLLVVGVLLSVYRSITALGLGLLPVATGALAGIAAVALGFGAVHGVTLGFGITLIGESVDYSVYFFIQSLRRPLDGVPVLPWRRAFWPTIRLGMLTSVCGFASLLPSGFPGLAQLGLYSISGLLAAALVTRFVLPELLPARLQIHDVAPWGSRLERVRHGLRRRGGGIRWAAGALAVGALWVLAQHHATLWSRELSALSPVAPADLRYDATLRADLGAANVLDLVVVEAPDLESALRGAERAAATLRHLIADGTIADFDSPSAYLPSLGTQRARRDALPDASLLAANLHRAAAHLGIDEGRLSPFLADVAAARRAPLATVDGLRGTSFASGFAALILHRADRWDALLPLRGANAVTGAKGAVAPDIDVARVAAALASADLPNTLVLDLKTQSDMLYAGYLEDALRLSACGFALIVTLLCWTLRSARRVARVLAPLVLAVITVAAGLALGGRELNILHLVGMLLIVAVGSNYALFFDREAGLPRDGTAPLTLASLAIANASTVIGFGLLSFSQVPVLEALGMTVAPGTFLALLFSALLTSPLPADAF